MASACWCQQPRVCTTAKDKSATEIPFLPSQFDHVRVSTEICYFIHLLYCITEPFLKRRERLCFFYVFFLLTQALYYSQPSTICLYIHLSLPASEYQECYPVRCPVHLDRVCKVAGLIPFRIHSVLLTRNYMTKDTFWFY